MMETTPNLNLVKLQDNDTADLTAFGPNWDALDAALAGKAPLASPTFTGTPIAPTAAQGTNTTQIATTAYVVAAINALLNGAPGALDTLKELADALGDDANFASTMTNALAGKADKTTVDAHLADFTQQIPYAVTAGSANTYTASTTPALSSLVAGVAITVKIHAANTGASTLNWDGKGAIPIKKANGNDVGSGNLRLNGVYTLRYDGTNFILQGEGSEYGTALASDVRNTKTLGTENGVIPGTLNLSLLVPSNIKTGVTIDGVTGTLIPGTPAVIKTKSYTHATININNIPASTYNGASYIYVGAGSYVQALNIADLSYSNQQVSTEGTIRGIESDSSNVYYVNTNGSSNANCYVRKATTTLGTSAATALNSWPYSTCSDASYVYVVGEGVKKFLKLNMGLAGSVSLTSYAGSNQAPFDGSYIYYIQGSGYPIQKVRVSDCVVVATSPATGNVSCPTSYYGGYLFLAPTNVIKKWATADFSEVASSAVLPSNVTSIIASDDGYLYVTTASNGIKKFKQSDLTEEAYSSLPATIPGGIYYFNPLTGEIGGASGMTFSLYDTKNYLKKS